MATDALIGTFARTDDESLRFLYHLLGRGTGEWDVPIGGMGAVSGALAEAATAHGAEIITGADVHAIDPEGTVHYRRGDVERWHVPRQRKLAPAGFGVRRGRRRARPRPVALRDLIDPTILSDELRRSGAQTLTVFGLHTPHFLAAADPESTRRASTEAVLSSLNSVLAEPIQDVLMVDANGLPCIEAKTTADLDATLNMTAGNIFHGGLQWPFVEDVMPLDTPAQRWGVATDDDRILLCGSGSRRGGAVSRTGGHNAAMAVLQTWRASAPT